jgi:hypothetical protein
MPSYRQPTEKESKKLDEARKKTAEGIEAEKDMFSRLMPTMAKDARDQIRAGKAMRESVPAAAREGEAYNQAGFNKGGKVKKMNVGGVGRVQPVPRIPAHPSLPPKRDPNPTTPPAKKPGSSSSQNLPDNLRTGGKVSSASSRADGCAVKGKTKGRMV